MNVVGCLTWGQPGRLRRGRCASSHLPNARRRRPLARDDGAMALDVPATLPLEAFERRDPNKTGLYSFEGRPSTFSPAFERAFRRDAAAWTFFRAQPPGYRRLMTFWVMSARREETRQRRLTTLIEHSARYERLPMLTSPTRRSPAE